MKLKNLTLTLALILLSVTAANAAAPLNDSILKATPLLGTYQNVITPDVGTATAATTDPLLNGVTAGKTIWYQVNPIAFSYFSTWTVTVRSLSASGKLGIYGVQDLDNPLTSLSSALSVQTIGAGQTVTYSSSAGSNRLYLMLAGTGTFEITHYLPNSYTSNDFPSTAATLTGIRGTVKTKNELATRTANEPATPNMANSLWYAWTPSFNGPAAVDTNFSFLGGSTGPNWRYNILHQTALAVFTGTPGALTLVANNYGGGFYGTNSYVPFNATAGVTYYIEVGTNPGESPGDIELNYYQANTAGVIEFLSSYDTQVAENTDGATIIVRRRYAGNFSATAHVASIAGGSATAGADYTAVNENVSFPSGTSWQTGFSMNILDDNLTEANENIILQLSAPSGTATLGTAMTGIKITDNESLDESGYLPFHLQENVIRVTEGSFGTSVEARNALVRSLPVGEGLNIAQAIMPGTTAQPQIDFETENDYMSPTQLRTELRTEVFGDNIFEADEVIKIRLNIYDSGVPEQPQPTYTIIIEDDDAYIPFAGKLVAPLSYGTRQAQLFATISGTGAVTGKLMIIGQTLAFKSQLDWRGRVHIPLLPAGRALGFMLSLEAADATGGFSITLADGISNSKTTAAAVLQNYAAVVNPCPELGRYTFVTSNNGPVTCPVTGALTVDAAGNAVFNGRAFDGTAFTCAGYVDGAGIAGGQAALYAGFGGVGFNASLPLVEGQTSPLNALLLRPARAGDATKLAATVAKYTGAVCRYSAPPGQRALDCWAGGTGKAALTGGPLMSTLTKALAISTTNVVTAPLDAEKLKLTLVPATGLFSGSFVLSGTTKTLPISGALIDLPSASGYGQGAFFDGLKGGKIVIDKP